MVDNLQQTPPQGQSLLGRSPLAFFMLVFALAIPFWVIGGLTGFQLLPGLPVTALMAVCPVQAALILAYRENRSEGVTVLLRRAFDYQRITAKIWYAPILLLMPVVMVLSFGVMRLSGTPVPAPLIAVLPTLILCLVFFIAGLCEELGWSGYALEPLQLRMGALKASIVFGSVCAIFHYVALVQADRSVAWIAWWSLSTVALRVIIVWLYNNTGKSVFAVALLHMMFNVTWQLFPVDGSYYDPRISGSIMALVAVIVIIVWGPRTLTRQRFYK